MFVVVQIRFGVTARPAPRSPSPAAIGRDGLLAQRDAFPKP
jgi:hypothetical protein